MTQRSSTSPRSAAFRFGKLAAVAAVAALAFSACAADTMKLVTTYAALEMLGPTHQWKTEFYTDGTNHRQPWRWLLSCGLRHFWL